MKLLIFVALCLLSGANAQIRWVAARQGQVPMGAFVTGHRNGAQLYACRLTWNNNLVAGFLDTRHHACFSGLPNQHLWYRGYDVAVGTTFNWINNLNASSRIPGNAVHAGITATRATTYVCRISTGGQQLTGNACPHNGGYRCFVSLSDRSVQFDTYSILVDTTRAP